jgi:hypothetical protein
MQSMADPSPSSEKQHKVGPKKGKAHARTVPAAFANPGGCTLRSGDNPSKFQGPAGDRVRQVAEARQWLLDAKQKPTAAMNLLADGQFYPRRSLLEMERSKKAQESGGKPERRKWNEVPPPPPAGNEPWFWPLINERLLRKSPGEETKAKPKAKKQCFSKPPKLSDLNKWLVAHRALRKERGTAAAGGEPEAPVSDDTLRVLVGDVLSRSATIVEGDTPDTWAISADEATELATMDIPKDDAWRKWFAAIRRDMSTYRCVRSEVGATVYDEAMLQLDKSVTTGGGSSGGPRAQERPSRQPVAAQPTAPPTA